MDCTTRNNRLYAEGFQLAAEEEDQLRKLTPERLEANAAELLNGFPGLAIVEGYARGLLVLSAAMRDEAAERQGVAT